jgi:uncharacterized Fe-S center protein
MDKAKVFYSSLENKGTTSPLNKIKKLINRCGAKDMYDKGNLVAVKVHFGELGNTAFLRPILLRPVIELLNQYGTKPYLTDTNTLYTGMRTNSVYHHHNANWNGFGYSTLQVPVIIADGLRGENKVEVPVPNGQVHKHAILAADIVNADALVLVSHFKGHVATGFGGALKNLAMGCAARAGKRAMHSCTKPYVDQAHCTACGRCKQYCQVDAIKISGKADIQSDICTGCARCVGVCPEGAIHSRFDTSNDDLQRGIAEYAAAVLASYDKPVICLNILTSIVPSCDCLGANDAPLVHDLGFMASTDPVALDKACRDLILQHTNGEDIFLKANGMSGEVVYQHAEAIGLGTTDYQLEKIG